MSSRRQSALSIPASGSSRPATEQYVASIEVAITVAVYAIPATEQYVALIEVAITVAVYAIPAAQQYVTSIKVAIAITIDASAAGKEDVIAIATIATIAKDIAAIRPATIPTPITSVMTVHKLGAFLIVEIRSASATTSSTLAK